MLIVDSDPAVVEQALAAGELSCPTCAGSLRPWGFARERALRDHGVEGRLRVRRSRCRACEKTHVLLPDSCLLRRRDSVSSIGRALLDKVTGKTRAAVAAGLGVPADTVRGWFRRFSRRAEELRARFWAHAHLLDPSLPAIEPAGSAFADALGALGVLMRAATRRLGARPEWAWASVLTGGLLLANTSSPCPST